MALLARMTNGVHSPPLKRVPPRLCRPGLWQPRAHGLTEQQAGCPKTRLHALGQSSTASCASPVTGQPHCPSHSAQNHAPYHRLGQPSSRKNHREGPRRLSHQNGFDDRAQKLGRAISRACSHTQSGAEPSLNTCLLIRALSSARIQLPRNTPSSCITSFWHAWRREAEAEGLHLFKQAQ